MKIRVFVLNWLLIYASASSTRSPTAAVPMSRRSSALPLNCGHTLAHAWSRSLPASINFGIFLTLPICSRSIAMDRIAAMGFAMFCPAMSGAEPCTGSNMLGPPAPLMWSGLMLPDAAMPMPPAMAAPRSVMMSPNMFVVTMVS